MRLFAYVRSVNNSRKVPTFPPYRLIIEHWFWGAYAFHSNFACQRFYLGCSRVFCLLLPPNNTTVTLRLRFLSYAARLSRVYAATPSSFKRYPFLRPTPTGRLMPYAPTAQLPKHWNFYPFDFLTGGMVPLFTFAYIVPCACALCLGHFACRLLRACPHFPHPTLPITLLPYLPHYPVH